jgi:dUTP pyrophosphatase
MEVLQVKKLSEYATIPKRASQYAAGFDLSSACDVDVPPRGKALVKTDISIAIPENTYARIAPRSGLALKNFIDVGAGVVDYDYRGNVGVVLFNHSENVFSVKRGDRIAQLILEKISMADIVEVCELSETTRGEGGFGSSGVNSFRAEMEKIEKILKFDPIYEPRNWENTK